MAVAWCFEDEKTSYTEKILELFGADAEGRVPALWPIEVTNALLTAERRKRMTVAQTTHYMGLLTGLPISIDTTHVAHAFDQILPQARQWNLTVYDAAYLELALRESLPLATLDEDLKKAAKAAGIALFQP